MRARVQRGLVWKGVSSATLQGSRLVVGLLLAHLLTPHDYGVAGMAIVFASLVFVFSDLSFGAALVQRRELTEDDRSTVFWTSAAVGLVLTLCGIALSGPLASFYDEPQVRPLFAVMSLSFLVTSVASTQTALLTREMNFRALELRQIACAVVSAGVGITLAAMGYGPWAIIAQQVVSAFVSTTLLWFSSPWRPRLAYSFASLRSLGGYSWNVFGARLLFYLNRNADNLLVGRFLGAAALGAYSVAYNVMLLPFSQVSVPVQDVLFPAFSRLQDDRRTLASTWLRANRVIAAVTVPALVGLIVVAPDFVHVVLGERWHRATPVIQILAWVGLLQSLQGLNGSVLRAVDRTNLLFRYSLVVVTASLIAFVLGLHWGIVGVAAAYALSSTLVEPYYTWLTARSVDVSLRRFVGSLAGVAQASAVMLVAVTAVSLALTHLGISPAIRLLTVVFVGFVVYVPCCHWRTPELLEEFRRIRRARAARGVANLRPVAASDSR